jgi:hypothetical protein
MTGNPAIDARAHLRTLVGKPIRTFRGSTMTVLDVQDRAVVVQTPRSPEGVSVPIARVQRAIDQLLRDGAVAPTAAALGRSSGFVGAVLLSLPGVTQAADPARILRGTTQHWTLPPGRSARRDELQDLHGADERTRILPSDSSPNVLIFADPGATSLSADRWDDGVLHFEGEELGDGTAARGNWAILNHRQTGRALRVFWGTGREVEYAGEFELDSNEPFYAAPTGSPGEGALRYVLIFRLVPVGATVRDRVAPGDAGTGEATVVAAAREAPEMPAPAWRIRRPTWGVARSSRRLRRRAAVLSQSHVAGRAASTLAAGGVWPPVLLLSCLAVATTTYGWTSSPLRPLVTTWFLLVCPGVALVRLLPRRGALALLVLSIATSLSLETIVAEVMLESRAWSPRATLAILITITSAGAATQLRRAAHHPVRSVVAARPAETGSV